MKYIIDLLVILMEYSFCCITAYRKQSWHQGTYRIYSKVYNLSSVIVAGAGAPGMYPCHASVHLHVAGWFICWRENQPIFLPPSNTHTNHFKFLGHTVTVVDVVVKCIFCVSLSNHMNKQNRTSLSKFNQRWSLEASDTGRY